LKIRRILDRVWRRRKKKMCNMKIKMMTKSERKKKPKYREHEKNMELEWDEGKEKMMTYFLTHSMEQSPS
jgi:hypothetical protein